MLFSIRLSKSVNQLLNEIPDGLLYIKMFDSDCYFAEYSPEAFSKYMQ